jgi:hypothetical protein
MSLKYKLLGLLLAAMTLMPSVMAVVVVKRYTL